MIIDGRTVPDGTTVDTDVCIVGSGFAGLSLALRIARDTRLSVCMLESGGLDFDEAIQTLAEAETTGQPYYPPHETRIRAFGGTSMSWGGCCTPLDAISFERRPWVGDGHWPFAAATLDPYLVDALEFCGVDAAEQRRTEAAFEAQSSAAELDGGGVVPALMYVTRPVRLGSVYRKAVRAARGIALYLHSTATEIEADDQGAHALGIRVRCLSGTGFRVQARSYVLAGGGIENARLLMLSSGSPGHGLAGASGALGRYFMEHPRIRNRYHVRPGDTPLARYVGVGSVGTLRFNKVTIPSDDERWGELLAYHANLQSGYVGELAPGWPSVRRLAIRATRPWNEMPYYHGAGGGPMKVRLTDVGTALRRPDLAVAGAFAVATQPPSMRRFVEIYSGIEQAPDRLNRIELLAERDALGMPKVRLHWTVGEVEERTYRRGLQLVLAELERLEPGLSAAGLDAEDPWPSGIEGTWHHMGTTRMDDDPARGVVDPDCRAHGVDNLYVAGSSVFPVSASLAPTVTIVQLSLRLAEHLARSLEQAGRIS